MNTEERHLLIKINLTNALLVLTTLRYKTNAEIRDKKHATLDYYQTFQETALTLAKPISLRLKEKE